MYSARVTLIRPEDKFDPYRKDNGPNPHLLTNVRCLSDGEPETWSEAIREVELMTMLMGGQGYEVRALFRNQVDEITPTNTDRSLFYFLLLGSKK